MRKRRSSTQPARKQQPSKRRSCLGGSVGGLFRAALWAAGGWIAYSHWKIDHRLPLLKAIPAEQIRIPFAPSGTLNGYIGRQGSGRPLLLIHSVNAAASAYEMRPLFQHYRGSRPVLALDLPGFGFSTRPDVDYIPELFAQAVLAGLQQFDGAPADIIALSLGSEFAAHAARQRPDLVHSLTLLSPSGLGQRPQEMPDDQQRVQRIHRLLRIRLWARPLFDLLTTRRGINYYLKKSFAGPVDPGLADYAYATAHQPGAEYAPLTFISGKLFTLDAARTLYSQVATPTLVIYDQDAYVKFDLLPDLLRQHPAWRAERIAPTLGLPHFEQIDATTQTIDRFWKQLETENQTGRE